MVLVELEMGGHKFKLHERLKQKLDNIIKMQKDNWDAMFLIDGIEGCGKSTLAITCAWYLSQGKLKIYNLCSGGNEAIDKLKKIEEGGVMIIDEGSLMFSSSDHMKKEQKTLIQILNVIRQKRMILIIVSPSFFRLNRYVAIDRSRFLLHTYTTKDLKRGRFLYFGQRKKNKLFELGKKNFNSYKKPKADWNGSFVDFNPFGEDYQKVKKRSLEESLQKPKKELSTAQIRKLTMSEVVKEGVKKLPIELKNKTDLANFLGVSIFQISRLQRN